MAVGRISGPLLKANLLRQGVDLAFETDLIYLKVTDADPANHRVGIKTNDPTDDLHVNGTSRTTSLLVDTLAEIADISISGTTVSTSQDVLTLDPAGTSPVVFQAKLRVDDIELEDNVIRTHTTNTNLELRPNGTGTVEIFADTNVYGNIHATGNIVADGNIQIGDANTDNITFNADVSSNIVPDATETYNLGSTDKRWSSVWTKDLFASGIVTTDLTVDGVTLNTRQGNILYVAVNGDDTYSGTHQNDPFATISKAFETAVAGDTVYVYPGVYYEHFPLEIPSGVTLKGASLRSTTLRPHPKTMWDDAFHMNGEATVEDLTIMGFYHDPDGTNAEYPLGAATGGTGHAFRFSNGAQTTTRSPYVRNVTVITTGTPSELSITAVQTEVLDTLTRIKNIISDIVTNTTITKTSGNTATQDTALPVSDSTTGTVLEGLIDNVIYVINNGTQRTSMPTFLENDIAVTSGMLYKAAVILEANKEFIKEEANAYAQFTYPGTCDPDKTKRDAGYVVDSLITDIKSQGGNEYSILTGFNFWVQPTDDPRGYARGDAGHGAFVDGGIVNPASKEAAMLFHSVTFLTPAAETLIARNGARVEWLNSFTYFANKGMYLSSGTDGFAGQGKTEIRLDNTTGTFNVSDTVTYYDTDGTTVLASGTIAKKDADGKIYLTGKVEGLETAFERGSKTITAYGDAQLSTSIKKWGTASLALDGTGDYAFVQSNADFAFGTGAFCVEAWVYNTSAPGTNQVIFDFRTTDPQYAPTIYIDGATNHLHFSSNGTVYIDTGASLTLNTWTHIALAKSGTSTKFFKNGTQVGATYTDNNTYVQGPLTIGARYTATFGFHGYIDDVRVSKGTARYTSNFTAPTAILPNDSYTVLLSRFDGGNTSTNFVDESVLVQDVRSSSGGTSSKITLVDYSDFGAEVRSIGSACVYGDYGIYGDGLGVVAYLIGQNLAYIGTGKRTDNDPTYVIQDNEVTELNGAKIYYSSVDHKGDYRVGDLFYVNQEDGTVTFTSSNFNITSTTGVTFTDGVNTTTIDGTKVETGNIRISGNTIESLLGDVNITSASDIINLQNNVNITGNLDVTGNVTIGGNITLGNQDTDTISFVAGINSNIIPRVTETYDLGTPLLQWANVYTGNLHVDNVNVNNNVVTTVTGNANLELRAAGTGEIYVPSNNVQIDNDLTVNGTTNLAVTNVTGAIEHTGDLNQTGNVLQTGDYTVTGTLDVGNVAQFEDIKIDANQITTTVTNNDLQLLANGTGRIYIPSNDVQIDQNLTVVGTTTTQVIESTGRITANQFFTSDILIDDNVIETTITNSNLNLIANGTGVIRLEEFDFSSNVISNNAVNDIVIQPGTGKTLIVTSTQSIVIPIGTTAERPSPATAGMVRFNTDLSRYEGYDGTDWIRLDSRVVDLDENTYITAESTPGANDNTIRFYNDGSLTADLTSTRLQVPRVEVDNIVIDNSTISSVATNSDIIFNATGTGSVRLANFAFKDNIITNTVTDSITTITQTGNGYFKIAGTNGFVVPTGNSVQRPAYAVLGMTRYNAEVKQLEVFNGTSWESAAGSSGAINANTATDLAIETVLMLG